MTSMGGFLDFISLDRNCALYLLLRRRCLRADCVQISDSQETVIAAAHILSVGHGGYGAQTGSGIEGVGSY